jgi:hypothetical protein
MKNTIFLLFLVVGFCTVVNAQENHVKLAITLKNNTGGFYKNQEVELISKTDGTTFKASTNNDGIAAFKLPTNDIYTVHISNYSRKREIIVPDIPGGSMTNTFSYAPNMIEMQKKFEMSASEKLELHKFIATLPDTLKPASSQMVAPTSTKKFYATTTIELKDLKNGPLVDEAVTISGKKSNKSIKTSTDNKGTLLVYLPKGDTYSINFTYNKNYAKYTIDYSKGNPTITLGYSYIGTAEIEKRKEIEKLRVKALEEELKAEEAAFKTECDLLGLTLEACRKRELETHIKDYEFNDGDQVITKVMARNNWSNKLVVCDLTGSMSPYSAELSVWYALNMSNEKDIQFTFFNDGDDMEDENKIIGKTGGIYYSSAIESNQLLNLSAKVAAAGSGGDAEENDVEAIIRASSAASPFKNLILIADSDSPVRDIRLLKDVEHPVHVILCGFDGTVYTDYLNMAWKTKGSIHTIEEDITRISTMSEGQSIQIGDHNYKIMGGNFILID